MAAEQYTVYVPDRSEPFRLPATLTHEEVRQTIAGMGYTAVETAELVVRGNELRFRRVAGGTKGL